jgi:hypothetical protein
MTFMSSASDRKHSVIRGLAARLRLPAMSNWPWVEYGVPTLQGFTEERL